MMAGTVGMTAGTMTGLAEGEIAGGETAMETETGATATTIKGGRSPADRAGHGRFRALERTARSDYVRAGDATPGAPRLGMARPIAALRAFWRGEVPLGRAFWLWGVVSGGIVSIGCTILALAMLAGGAQGWLALAVFAAHIPWNLVLLVGVWRSSDRSKVQTQQLARLAIVAWVLLLSAL